MVQKASAQSFHGSSKVHHVQVSGSCILQPAVRIQVPPYWESLCEAPAQGEAMAEHAPNARIQLQQENLEHCAGYITSEGENQWSVEAGKEKVQSPRKMRAGPPSQMYVA